MDRIRGTSVSAALAAATGVGTAGYFTGGDPSAGVPATVITAEWLNTIQEELANVVTGSGLVLDPANRSQLLQAINVLIAGVSTAPSLPAGVVAHFARNTAPTGWLKANGAAVSRATYATLFAAIGTTFGAGDGATTFQLPDLRGEFVRGWDDGRSADSGRGFGSFQADELRSHSHRFKIGADSSAGSNDESASTDVGGWEGGWIEATGGAETRPRNVALLACIKF